MSLGIAAFVSAHGWGHAARASAVLAELRRRRPGLRLHLFTTVPRWFLEESLGPDFRSHAVDGDVGLVQRDALREDAGATAAETGRFLRHLPARSRVTAGQLRDLGIDLVVADIAPLGIEAGRRAGIPVALVENFTWDWIYGAYFDVAPALRDHAARLEEIYVRADLRVQTAPVCSPLRTAVSTAPVARPLRAPEAVRDSLGIPAGRPLVVVSMGGVDHELPFAERMRQHPDVVFVLLADGDPGPDNVRMLSRRRRPYHPDLLAAADVVVGKLGYSTVAEALQGGARFAWVSRPRFPETPVLRDYLEKRLPTHRIEQESFARGDWVEELPSLLRDPARRWPTDGAGAVADALLTLVDP